MLKWMQYDYITRGTELIQPTAVLKISKTRERLSIVLTITSNNFPGYF